MIIDKWNHKSNNCYVLWTLSCSQRNNLILICLFQIFLASFPAKFISFKQKQNQTWRVSDKHMVYSMLVLMKQDQSCLIWNKTKDMLDSLEASLQKCRFLCICVEYNIFMLCAAWNNFQSKKKKKASCNQEVTWENHASSVCHTDCQ